jgi:hypothetical protein
VKFVQIKSTTMEHIFHTIPAKSIGRTGQPSVFSRFIAWCESQEKYRFGWLGGILAIHGCALTPITLFAVVLFGTNFAL